MAFRTNKTPILQEKSASGSVASFNAAIAMPLVNGEFSIEAYQEGTGDPSPTNVRAIHGFSEVNVTRAGKNRCPYANLAGKRRVEKSISLPIGSYVFSALCTSTDTDSTVCAFIFQYTDGTYSSLRQLQRNVRSSNTINIAKPTRSLFIYASNNDTTSVNDDFTFSDIQIELGSTATSYEPYVTPTIYTIQLGQEVYGAEVDVNGVAHVTDVKEVFDLSDYATTFIIGNFIRYSYNLAYAPIINNAQKCNIAPFAYNNNENLHFYCDKGTYNRLQLYLPNDISSASIEVKYPLDEPFDIQLTPQQIKTLIGNNTIFADTGDTSLTYKDLDIAKRGNFREVFKLPS